MTERHEHLAEVADEDRDTGVVILAAGGGERLGHGPKGLVKVAGVPMLRHVLHAVRANRHAAEIVVTAPSGAVDEYAAMGGLAGVRVVAGGGTRQDSARAGIATLSPYLRWVAVTDVARPFTPPGAIDELLEHLALARADRRGRQPCGAAHVLTPHDSLHLADAGSLLTTSVDRAKVRAAQTPQLFRRDCLAAAYAAADAAGLVATDDIGAITALGGLALAVPGDALNIKVTVGADLRLAEAIASLPARAGQGRMASC